jgi:peptidoglycan hydrolase CwlO-like protein
MSEDNVTLSDEQLQKLAGMIGEMKDDVSVIRVGNDTSLEKDQLERYKKSNKQLRQKIERNISEIMKLEAEIRELQADAYINTDEGKGKINKALRDQKSSLKRQLDRSITLYNDKKDEVRDLETAQRSLKSIETNLTAEVQKLTADNKSLTDENVGLRAEIDIRIKEDNRFKNLDL